MAPHPTIPSQHLWRDQIVDTPDEILTLLFDNYRVLMYAGDFDGSMCNQLGVYRTLRSVPWGHSDSFNAASRCLWRMGGQPAGMAQSAGGLTWVVVFNSGHLVPMNQPAHAFEMIRRLLDGSTPSLCEQPAA